MLSKCFLLLSLAASISAIPVPNPQTPDYRTLDTCPTNGAIVCSPDGSSFYLCNFGRAVPMGSVAAGTTCKNGKIYTIGASAAPTPEPEPQPTAMPSYVPEPTTAELVMTTPEAKPTQAPMNPMPEPLKEEVTSTITSIQNITTKLTTTILVTMTGKPPSAPSETTDPTPTPKPNQPPTSDKMTITEEVILKVAPLSVKCPREVYPDRAPEQCATAGYAAPYINEAFEKYNINTIGERAAILSLIAYETLDLQFNTNQFGIDGKFGRPGQGTRNMMMAPFIVQYAQTFGSTDSIKPGLTPENILSQTDEIKNKVLALVLSDDKAWASGAWYYRNFPPCATIASDLQQTPVSMQAWEKYIVSCVEGTVDDRRVKSFKNAIEALGGTLSMG